MTNTFVLVIRLQDVLPKFFKTFSRHLTQTSSKHLQDVFITSSRPFAKLSSRRLAKTSSRNLQDIFKTFCKDLFKDVFKTYHQVKLLLLTRLREVLNTFLRHSFLKTVIYRRICLSNTTSEIFMVSVQNSLER